MTWNSAPLSRLIRALSTTSSEILDRIDNRFVSLAFEQRVIPQVGERLRRQGAQLPPPSLAAFVSTQQLSPADRILASTALHAERNADLRRQLKNILHALDRAGIATLPLKGAALLEEQPSLARELTDIDLLVLDHSRLEEARLHLLDLGYRDATPEEYAQNTVLPDEHQLRPLLLDGHPGSVELHRTVLQSEYHHLFTDEFVRSELIHTEFGWRLSRFARALHAVLHSTIVDQSYRRFDPALRTATDIVQIAHNDATVIERLASWNASPLVRRAIDAQLLVAGLLDRSCRRPLTQAARRWWWCTRTLSRIPIVHKLIATAAMAPFALSRERMEARAERRLGFLELARLRLQFILSRTVQYLRERR